jgi:hypothetical protein
MRQRAFDAELTSALPPALVITADNAYEAVVQPRTLA